MVWRRRFELRGSWVRFELSLVVWVRVFKLLGLLFLGVFFLVGVVLDCYCYSSLSFGM